MDLGFDDWGLGLDKNSHHQYKKLLVCVCVLVWKIILKVRKCPLNEVANVLLIDPLFTSYENMKVLIKELDENEKPPLGWFKSRNK